MTDSTTTDFVVNQFMFDKFAELEGKIVDGFKVHSVDRKAGTLCVGAHRLHLVNLSRINAVIDDMLDLCKADPIQPDLYIVKPRGAQWKRENNRHRRSW